LEGEKGSGFFDFNEDWKSPEYFDADLTNHVMNNVFSLFL